MEEGAPSKTLQRSGSGESERVEEMMCPSYMSEDDGPPLLPIISSSPSKKAQISRNHVPAPPAPTPPSNRRRSINFPSLSDCGRDTCFDSLLLRPCLEELLDFSAHGARII